MRRSSLPRGVEPGSKIIGQIQRSLCRRWEQQVRELPLEAGPWRLSRRIEPDDPVQGWKLHLSATILSASGVFECAAAILIRDGVLFKVPVDLELLNLLNSGLRGFSQIGKFLTAYPRDVIQARAMARALHLATRGLPGPAIPFDEPYRPGSLVYYRYGAFRPQNTAVKDSAGVIFDPDGRSYPDVRGPARAVPVWLNESLIPAPARRNVHRRRRGGPLGLDFLPFKVLSRRGKGGVYESLDLRTIPARLCVIKEGRRHGETQWDGSDGCSRLRHEVKVLRQLRRAGLLVPEVLAEFSQCGHHYVVLEKLPGRLLLPSRAKKAGRQNWRKTRRMLDRLTELLTGLHSLGWVWRDCKPTNLMTHRGRLWAFDFEGACRIDQTDVMPWGSPAFSPPESQTSSLRVAGVFEDRYAAGASAFLLGTGKPPSGSPRARWTRLRQCGCPRKLAERIQGLLRDPGS